MQRSLVQVVAREERERLVKALVDYIIARQGLSLDGCPLLMLYPFLQERKLPSSWLINTLKELKMEGEVFERTREHYVVFRH